MVFKLVGYYFSSVLAKFLGGEFVEISVSAVLVSRSEFRKTLNICLGFAIALII